MKGDFSRDTFNQLKHFSRVLEQQGRVRVDADSNEQTAILLHYLRTLVTDLIGPYAGPEGSTGFKIGKIKDDDFSIGSGRYYVDGILCENEAKNVTYRTQQDYPNPPKLKGNGPYLVYLDVWERHITALEDDYIREKALGGPDTSTRAKIIWQVKMIDDGTVPNALSLNLTDPDEVLRKNWAEWKKRWQPTNRGSLRARVKRPEDSTDPCLAAPDAKYRGQENQLYRIEIHKKGKAEEATFKWSRDNGSVVSRVLEWADNELIVAKSLGFEPGIWIELSNDGQELRGEPGSLVKLLKVEGDRFTLESEVFRPDDILESEKWPTKVRRWDQRENNKLKFNEGAVFVTEGKDETNWIEIENGIEIQFMKDTKDEHFYRSGDCWLIPARIATGDIEWPVEMDENGNPTLGNKIPIPQEPFGIQHHYAPLAILSPSEVKPCQCEFKPLNCDPHSSEL